MSLWSSIARAFRAPAETAPKAVLAGLGSGSSFDRLPVSKPLVSSDAPAGNRFPADRPPVVPRPAPSVQVGRMPRQRAALPAPTPDRRPEVLPTDKHVHLFFAFVVHNFQAGEMIDAGEMARLYAEFCDRSGLVPRKWNPIAKDLKFLMAPGPKGSGKPYHNCLQADGSYKEMRVWFVPKGKEADPRSSARKTQRPAGRQSTPEMRAAA